MTHLNEEIIENRIASNNQTGSVKNLDMPQMFDAAFRVDNAFEEAKGFD